MQEQPQPIEWTRDGFTVSCDPARLDLSVVHEFLANSYWATGVPAGIVERSIANSICFALFAADEQIGFARVITDRAVFAYLADVFVLPAHRGRGLGKWLVSCALAHPDLQGLRRWMLATRDAHELYRRCGFTPLKRPETFMELHDPDVYRRSAR